MADRPNPPDLGTTAADLLFFGPLGFVLSARTLVPQLISEGRKKTEEQVRLARTIGQFVVPIARRKVEKTARERLGQAEALVQDVLATRSPQPEPRRATAAPVNASGDEADGVVARARTGSGNATARRARGASTGSAAKSASAGKKSAANRQATPKPRAATTPPAGNRLGIDGYDALPASTIVGLLDGLTKAQLRAVDAHESAGRQRSTILHGVAQRLAPRS